MLFCRLLPRIAFTLIFWTIFHRFWMKFERKNRWFFQAVLAFSHLAKTMRFAGYPAWGQCFYENAEIVKITYFFEKSMKKTIGNLTCRKSQKTTSWESQNWPKIDENWKEKARKARKLGEKSSFWKARFFTLFLVGLCTHFLLKKKYSGRVRRHARESGKGKGWDNPRPQEHPSRNREGSGCEF